jgi:hypothetical protein
MSQPANPSTPQPSKQPASSRQTLEGDNTGNIIGNIHAGGDVYINTSLPKASPQPVPPKLPANAKIFISYKRGVTPDETLALELYDALKDNHTVFIDRAMVVGTRWVAQIQKEIFQAHVLIVLLSEHSVQSQMVKEEIEQALKSADERQGFPVILPIRVAHRIPFPYPLSEYLDPLHWAFWDSPEDTSRLVQELTSAIAGEPLPVDTEAAKQKLLHQAPGITMPPPEPMAQPPVEQTAFSLPLELPEGTMDAESQFYIQRAEDAKALSTIAQQGGVTITIKGPRQMGKSSLLIRTMAAARELDKRTVFLDFQLFGKAVLADENLFYRRFCEYLTRKLRLKSQVAEWWQEQGDSSNPFCCTDYVQYYLLEELAEPLVLAMDEVESLFSAEFRSDFFSMLRAWHNARAHEPIWKQLDLVLVTSTEPYQLIQDLDKSPFNVGEVLDLENFSPAAVAELNRRHGSPLTETEVQTLMEWLHGHPYLVRKALYLVASGQMSAANLFARATDDRGPFGDHLRYHLFRMHDKPNLVKGMLQAIRRQTCTDKNVFWRLRGAGLLRESGKLVFPRCKLYADYFKEHLRE